jgi:hypothetical protein
MPSRSFFPHRQTGTAVDDRARDTHLDLLHNPFLAFTECLQFNNLMRFQWLFDAASVFGGFIHVGDLGGRKMGGT